MRAVEIGVGLGELAMLGFELFELLFQALHVLFFALAECALRGAVLSSSALRKMLASRQCAWMEIGAGGWDRSHSRCAC